MRELLYTLSATESDRLVVGDARVLLGVDVQQVASLAGEDGSAVLDNELAALANDLPQKIGRHFLKS